MAGLLPALRVQPQPARHQHRHPAPLLHPPPPHRPHARGRDHRDRGREERRAAHPRGLRRTRSAGCPGSDRASTSGSRSGGSRPRSPASRASCWAATASSPGGKTSKDCYQTTLRVIQKAADWLDAQEPSPSPSAPTRRRRCPEPSGDALLAAVAPVLRGLVSSTLSPKVMHHVGLAGGARVRGPRALRGAGRPRHHLPRPLPAHARSQPLFVPFAPARGERRGPPRRGSRSSSSSTAQEYDGLLRALPAARLARHARPLSGARARSPASACCRSSSDKATARVAAEYYVNTINVMRWAEGVDTYVPMSGAGGLRHRVLDRSRRRKLQRLPKPKSLEGRVALVTGGAGGIGGATARRLLAEGASVVLTDLDTEALDGRHRRAAEGLRRGPRARRPLRRDRRGVRCATLRLRGRASTAASTSWCATRASPRPRPSTRRRSSIWQQEHGHPRHRLLPRRARGLPAPEAPGPRRLDRLRGQQERARGLRRAPPPTARPRPRSCTSRAASPSRAPSSGIRVNVVNPDAVIRGSRIWGGTLASRSGRRATRSRGRGRGLLPEAQPAEAQRLPGGRRGGRATSSPPTSRPSPRATS